jgi:hypothetical protein
VNGSIWSSKGCTLNEAESSVENVTCDCDHNTAFAIMMDVAGVQVRWIASGLLRLSWGARLMAECWELTHCPLPSRGDSTVASRFISNKTLLLVV